MTDSLLSPGCRVAGSVIRCVLGPGVVVEPGATVRDSVVFGDSVVRAGATVDWSVVDSGCTIERDASVGSPTDEVDDPDLVVLVGRGSRVLEGTSLEPGQPAGARYDGLACVTYMCRPPVTSSTVPVM